MIEIIAIFIAGIAAGYLLRKTGIRSVLDKTTTWTIWLMLFLLGLTVGSDNNVIGKIGLIGAEALLISLLGMVGSIMAAILLDKLFARIGTRKGSVIDSYTAISTSGETDNAASRQEERKDSGGFRMAGSLIVLGFFCLGCILGFVFRPEADLHSISLAVLFALMFQVGAGAGADRGLGTAIRSLDIKMLVLPIGTAFGTLSLSAIASLLLRDRDVWDCLAVGSGFGYYSLSSILITELKAATDGVVAASELGAVAMLCNIIREMTALVCAPLIYKYCGTSALISSCGVTSMDVVLPTISRLCGTKTVPAALYNGIAMDSSVPFLVPFFCRF